MSLHHDEISPRYHSHIGLLDNRLMAGTSILCIGVGGVSGALESIAAMGVSSFTLIDADFVAEHNVATQAYDTRDVGRSKVSAEESHILHVNPAAEVNAYRRMDYQMSESEMDFLVKKNTQLWIMTDDASVHGRINKLALKHGKDALFGGVPLHSKHWEIMATLAGGDTPPDLCVRDYTHARLEAYKEGREKPGSVPSHRLISNLLNDAILAISLGLIHYRGKSDHWIARYGEEFAKNPAAIGTLDLDWLAGPNEAFGHLDPPNRMFATRFATAQRPKGWKCPDCGHQH